MKLSTMLSIGVGGFIGANVRNAVSLYITTATPIPFATLIVNLLGSFILGSLFALFEKVEIPVHLKSLLSTGMMGALTTYSTFALQSFLLIHNGEYFNGILNMSLNLFGTVLFAAMGFILVEKLEN